MKHLIALLFVGTAAIGSMPAMAQTCDPACTGGAECVLNDKGGANYCEG